MYQLEHYQRKPIGLWISDEDDYGWKEWCEYNSPDYLGEHAYEIILVYDANILYLKTVQDIEAFTYMYRLDDDLYGMNTYDHVLAIDWDKLAKEYDGIIITPYHSMWTFGTSAVWYMGWDVASGCIWNSKAILASKLLSRKDTDIGAKEVPSHQ